MYNWVSSKSMSENKTEEISTVVEENVEEEKEPIQEKTKKPRSAKQIAAFDKARKVLLEKRLLKKSTNEEARTLAKSEKYKSKKQKELETKVKQIIPTDSLLNEEKVIQIINTERQKRKVNKQQPKTPQTPTEVKEFLEPKPKKIEKKS
jgi:hypothetical protein